MSSSEQPGAETTQTAGVDEFRPELITSEGLPIGMRGYDRDRVDRLVSRVSEAHRHLLRQRDALRERLGTLEAELEAAEGEARVSAKSVGELVQRSSTAESELAEACSARDDLAERLSRAEAARRQALTELRESTERVAELGKRVHAFEAALRNRPEAGAEEPTPVPSFTPAPARSQAGFEEEAAQLLLAATRASEELRETARSYARSAMKKARQRVAAVTAEAERERAALAEMHERRQRAEREAEEILARARAEADRVAAAIGEERDRVRTLLIGALASLDRGSVESTEGLVADLSSRLRESGATDDVDTPAQAFEPHS